ncbi:MAG: cytidylate kinase-like family protein [Oscillospiraceae bacterium]|jgi:cytidylate kinase|nr:cytidylate kinase-like family protein [Oscillospiraceae bacterium]
MPNTIIALSREYGSGGREIAEKLATELGFGFYDKSIIKLTAERSGLAPDYVEESEERVTNNFLAGVKYSSYTGVDSVMYYETPTTDKMFIAQSAVIKDLALKENCVIIGRCADYVLRDRENVVRVFIRAEIEDRVRRAAEQYGLPDKNTLQAVKKIDKTRANYYKYYTNRKWGAQENADLTINSSFTGIDGAVETIKALINAKGLG